MFSGQEIESGEVRNGKMEYATRNNCFVNEREILKVLEKSFKLEKTFIKSILELSEKDMGDFTKGRTGPTDIGPDAVDESFV